MNFLQGLNDQQREAVQHTEGPLLLFAGAGSGKTRVITHRICHLITEKNIPADAILAVTFTNKSAREMKDRVKGMLKNGTKGLTICTFHALGVQILRKYIQLLGFHTPFSIYDETDSLGAAQSVLRELGISNEVIEPQTARWLISTAKNNLQRDWMQSASEAGDFSGMMEGIYNVK